MKSQSLPYFLAVMTLFFLGCGVNPSQSNSHGTLEHQKHGDYQVTHLPLSQKWRQFQCREGSFAARYLDGSQKTISIQLGQGRKSTLTRRPSYNPAIFENGGLALYLNEGEAVLGRPNSPILMMTGCKVQ